MALPPGFVLEQPASGINLPPGFVLEQEPAPPEKQSAFRQIADVPLGIAKGAVQGIRMIADAFGAGSSTSNSIKSAETYLADLMSAQAKNDQQEISRIMKDAEDKGVLDQVRAAIKAFTIAPVDTLSSALGTAAPVIVGALGAKVLGAGALVSTGVSALTGAGMGAGVIKGSIYDETKRALIAAGASEQDAEQRAQLAQQYNGNNLDQILLGTVLGGAAAIGPLEKGAAGILARRILKKTGTDATESVAEQTVKGGLRRRAEAGLLEAVPEAVQAGQEQVAQNIALQREGFDVPTYRGVAGAVTLEAIAGGGLGATLGGGRPQVAPAPPAPVAETPVSPEAPVTPTTEAPSPVVPVAEVPPTVEAPAAPTEAPVVEQPVAPPVAETPAVPETPAAPPVETPATPVTETPQAPAVSAVEMLSEPTEEAIVKKEPATRKEAQAFGKAIGAAQPYPGELRGRVNLPAQKAAKEGNFQGVLSALEKSKNVIVAEIAKRARALGTKIVIDDDAEETYTGPSTLMRQMSIDGAKMHLEALNKIRALAPQVDALPDKAELSYAIRDEKITAIDGGEEAGPMSLEDIAKMGHSMFAPLATGPLKLRTKEDFKALQKAYEDLTSEYGENALQLTSTGSAEMTGVAGKYDADTDTILVPEYSAKREEVLSHEIVHAQTVQAIASPTLRQKPIVARLNKLYEHVKKELEGRPGRAPYGIQSIQEFVAEGMGNPAFQFLLKKIKYENTSAWDSFVQTIANLIGVNRDTAFTELLSIYSDLTTEQKAESKTEAPAAEATAEGAAPETNFLYSVEPTIKSDRIPSYKRGVENLRKRWDKGELTSDEFAARVDILAKQIQMAELAKEKTGRERGADFLRQRLLEAKRRGDLSPEAVDFAEWFILQNPSLVDDLGISIRTPKEDGVGGMYSSYGRVMYLMKERGSDQTVVHEILHHLERMMPKEVQSAIRKTWIKSLMEAQKNAKTDVEKNFFKSLTDFHFGFGSRSLLKAAIDDIKEGKVSKDLYQYTSPSEFWAENGSEIMKGRFDVKGSVLGRLKQWLSELKEKARALFGLENKAAIIRALDSLSKGDGKFVTSTLLDETTEPKLSVTPAASPGQQALETIRAMGMDVPKPDPTKLEKAKDIWTKAKEDPKLTAQSAARAMRNFLDKVETWSFSSDAKLNNDYRRAIVSDIKQNEGVIGQLLEMSQSQAVHADALASQFMIEGGLKYNDELKKWESFDAKANFPALSKKLDEIGKQYNLSKEQIERVAHAYLVAKRLPGLIERNRQLDEEIAAEQATSKPDKKKIQDLEEKKVFISNKQMEQMEPGLSLGKTIPELNQVVDMWNDIRKNTIDVMVNSGLWSPEYAQAMWDNMDYVPYFREDQIENEKGPQEFIRGLQVKSKEFQLKGSEDAVHDVFDNMIRWTQYAINRSVRAHKALQMIDNAKDIQVGDRKMAEKVTEEKRGMNIVRVFRDGKQELYDMADPLYVQAFAGIQNVSIPTLKFMSKISDVLRNSVVLYPLFSVAQVPQDSFAAMFTSGLKTQHALKIPYLAVKEFVKTLNRTSQTHETLKKFGATGVRDFSATVIRDDAEIYAGLKPPRGGWGKTKEFLSHISMAADNAVRQAVYEASIQQGVSRSEAIEKAFEVINFRRKGTSKMLNILGQTVPFFYAYLSAQRVAYKVLTGVGISPTDRAEAFKTLGMTSAAVATLSMLYAMANADDEDYMETPANIRDRTITIPGSGGVRIPLRPDFFLFPKIIAEHTYLLLSEQGYQDAAKFRTSMKDALISAIASPTPFPTAIKPAIEVAINYDFFQGKPLIGNFEKQKDLERQFRDSTSEFSKLLGQTGMISPIAADHMIRGMFGSFGGLFLFGTNQFLHSDPDVPRPEMNATEMLAALPGTSGLLKRPQESALKNDFYTLRDEVEKAVNTFNDIKTRSPEGMEAFLADEKNMARLMLGKSVDKINRQLSKIRRQITIVTNMPENMMSAADKADFKRQLMEMERELLRSVNVKELREMAKI